MANANKPFGLAEVSGEGKEFRVRRYVKKSGNAIYPGDPVIQTATGDIDVAGTTGALLGVAQEYGAASSVAPIAVCDDPEALFSIQANSAVVAADVFQNANVATGAGDSALRRSTFALDVGTLGTSATAQLKILGLTAINVNEFGSYAQVNVKINNHVLKGGTGTAGV